MRKLLAAALICLPFCVPQPGHASLNDSYPTDAYGNVEVPALSALSSAIVGSPMHALCAPSDPDYYGWTYLVDTLDDQGRVVSTEASDSIYISGDICAELERLTRWPDTKVFFRRPAHSPLWRDGRTALWVGDNEHVYYAGVAILTLVHESMHVKLLERGEARVECMAIANVWPTIAALRLPGWLSGELLASARTYDHDLPAVLRGGC